MTPAAILISTPNVNLEEFLRVSSKAIGHDLMRPVDSVSARLSNYEKYIGALASYHQHDMTRPISEIIANAASLCAHLHFSFLIAADRDTIFKSMERSGLPHTVVDGITGAQLALVSGTLEQWKRATIECCSMETDFNIRTLYDQIILLFEQNGLTKFWSDTRKRSHKDGTFLLEYKQ